MDNNRVDGTLHLIDIEKYLIYKRIDTLDDVSKYKIYIYVPPFFLIPRFSA